MLPEPSAGRSPPGSVSTRDTPAQASRGVATTNASHAAITPTRMRSGRRRPRDGGRRGGTGRVGGVPGRVGGVPGRGQRAWAAAGRVVAGSGRPSSSYAAGFAGCTDAGPPRSAGAAAPAVRGRRPRVSTTYTASSGARAGALDGATRDGARVLVVGIGHPLIVASQPERTLHGRTTPSGRGGRCVARHTVRPRVSHPAGGRAILVRHGTRAEVSRARTARRRRADLRRHPGASGPEGAAAACSVPARDDRRAPRLGPARRREPSPRTVLAARRGHLDLRHGAGRAACARLPLGRSLRALAPLVARCPGVGAVRVRGVVGRALRRRVAARSAPGRLAEHAPLAGGVDRAQPAPSGRRRVCRSQRRRRCAMPCRPLFASGEAPRRGRRPLQHPAARRRLRRRPVGTRPDSIQLVSVDAGDRARGDVRLLPRHREHQLPPGLGDGSG